MQPKQRESRDLVDLSANDAEESCWGMHKVAAEQLLAPFHHTLEEHAR
jgi:hypothetical protein